MNLIQVRFAMRLRSSITSLLLLSSLAACGGGADRADAPTAAVANESSNNVASIKSATDGTTSADTTWTLCAVENQSCTFTGTRAVRYGTATTYAMAQFTNGVSCSNAVFGDPVFGTVKSCWYGDATPPVTADAWISCATESQFCAFTGTRDVRYGTPTSFVTGSYANGVACNNGVFGDPAFGIVKSCSYAATPAAPFSPAAPVPVDTPNASGNNPPIVMNASSTAHSGDVISLQGENFGASPRVYFDGTPQTPLEIVNRVGTNWIAVQIPANAPKALVLRVNNGTGISARIPLNAAKPLHLDAVQLVPGGKFRVFGRALLLAGSTPSITVDGLAATIDVAHSDEYTLSAVVPATLKATSSAVLVVDNGNGTGATQLDRAIEVVTSGAGDPFSIGVSWAAGFAPFANVSIYAATDPRLNQKVVCDGSRDDTQAIRAAIDLAASIGGGVVRLPAGRCRMATGIELKSRVVVMGAGKTTTELVYESNYPVYGIGLDLTGIGNLTLTNSGSATEGSMLKNNTRLFMQNLRVQLMTSRQMYLTGNKNFAVVNSDFVQTAGISDQGPYILNDSAGLLFEGNTTSWLNGAPAFGHIHDSYVHANRFTRDARLQATDTGVVHSFTIDFAYRIAVVGNTFDVANGPVTNKNRNDGETIVTEGGGAARTENLGTVASATASTLSDPSNSFQLDPFGTGTIPENYGVAIVGGKGAGQTRHVVNGSGTTLTVDRAWDVIPDGSSHYATFVWGLERSLIKDNVLSQNPRGIWLYHTAIRDVDVIGNVITEGGGIYLRSFQNLSTKSFMPIYNVLIASNKISNASRQWGSYINSVFVNTDAKAFGIATIGVQIRSNEVTANQPNVVSQLEEYAGTEGFMNMMRVESYGSYETSLVPRQLGSILTSNTCTNCAVAVRIGTGAGGTTVVDTRLTNSPVLITDSTTTSTNEKSTDTVTR